MDGELSNRATAFHLSVSMFPTCLSDPEENAPGQLLADLERRQDEALEQLDDLEKKLCDVLKGLNIEMEEVDLD